MKRTIALFILAFFLATGTAFSRGSSEETSGVTAQDLIDDVRGDLSESQASRWDDADLIRWADEAVTLIVTMTGCLDAGEALALEAGVSLYTISTSHYAIDYVVYDSHVENSPERFHRLVLTSPKTESEEEEERPKMYWEENGQLAVWPIPNDTISGNSVVVYMTEKPTAITTASSGVSTPWFFDPLVRDYMLFKAYMKVERGDFATIFWNKFKEELSFFVGSMKPMEAARARKEGE